MPHMVFRGAMRKNVSRSIGPSYGILAGDGGLGRGIDYGIHWANVESKARCAGRSGHEA